MLYDYTQHVHPEKAHSYQEVRKSIKEIDGQLDKLEKDYQEAKDMLVSDRAKLQEVSDMYDNADPNGIDWITGSTYFEKVEAKNSSRMMSLVNYFIDIIESGDLQSLLDKHEDVSYWRDNTDTYNTGGRSRRMRLGYGENYSVCEGTIRPISSLYTSIEVTDREVLYMLTYLRSIKRDLNSFTKAKDFVGKGAIDEDGRVYEVKYPFEWQNDVNPFITLYTKEYQEYKVEFNDWVASKYTVKEG